jgi:hypothetical protein
LFARLQEDVTAVSRKQAEAVLEDKIGDVGIGLVGRGDNGGCGAVVLAVTTVNRLCGGALTEVGWWEEVLSC